MKLLTTLLGFAAALHANDLVPYDLQCEYHGDPIAIGTTKPRFSWKLRATESGARDLIQSAYQIQVARAEDDFSTDPLWETGQIASSSTSQIEYDGSPLASRDRLKWLSLIHI